MSDMVARKSGDPSHHLEHSRDDLLQDYCLIKDGFICDLVHENQNALQPIQKGRWHMVVFILFFQELNGQVLTVLLIQWGARTSNVTLVIPKTALASGFN